MACIFGTSGLGDSLTSISHENWWNRPVKRFSNNGVVYTRSLIFCRVSFVGK